MNYPRADSSVLVGIDDLERPATGADSGFPRPSRRGDGATRHRRGDGSDSPCSVLGDATNVRGFADPSHELFARARSPD